VGHGRREATSDRLIASAERPVTIILLTIGLSVTCKKPVSANRFQKINGFNIPKSDPNYVSRRLLDCVPVFHKIMGFSAELICWTQAAKAWPGMRTLNLCPLSMLWAVKEEPVCFVYVT